MIPSAANRRQFFQSVGAAAFVGATLPASLPDAFAKDAAVTDSMPIIDTHQHLWDTTKFKLPWHKGDDTKPLQRSFVMSDYLEAT